eukprot:3308713-Rhodomonas_salina.2
MRGTDTRELRAGDFGNGLPRVHHKHKLLRCRARVGQCSSPSSPSLTLSLPLSLRPSLARSLLSLRL